CHHTGARGAVMSGRAVLLAAGEGVAALAVGGVAGGMLFGNVLGLFAGVLDRHWSYSLAVAAGAVAAVAAALLAGVARRLGRWAPAAAGMVAGAVLLPVDVLIPPAWYEPHEVAL